MSEICITLKSAKKRTKSEAILELLNIIYEILNRFYYEFSNLYKLEEIKIEDKEEDGYVAFILSGHNKETSKYLKVTVISWYCREKGKINND